MAPTTDIAQTRVPSLSAPNSDDVLEDSVSIKAESASEDSLGQMQDLAAPSSGHHEWDFIIACELGHSGDAVRQARARLDTQLQFSNGGITTLVRLSYVDLSMALVTAGQ